MRLRVLVGLVAVTSLWPALIQGDQRPATARAQRTYVLKPGDRVVNLARRYGTSTKAILAANGLRHARSLRAGQEIVIPGTAHVTPRRASRRRPVPEPAWQRRARRLAQRLGLGSRRVAGRLLRGDLDRRWIRAAGGLRPPPTLRLPVAGAPLGRGWGSGPGGYHLALDLPGKVGTRISAAAPGIVAYAGRGLVGFGKVVLIVHPGGLVTLYAHNRQLKTVAGERVRRGTRVALLGSSGRSRGPHLHFELIHRGLLCDPLPLMRPVPRRPNGRPALRPGRRLTWPRRGGAPPRLRCAPRRRHPEYVGKPRGWRPPAGPRRAAAPATPAAPPRPRATVRSSPPPAAPEAASSLAKPHQNQRHDDLRARPE